MKIAINGCGVGGPTLAWWLKKYGHEPVLFEKASAPRKGGYLIDFWGTGYDIAEKTGVLSKLKEDAYFVRRVKSVSSGGWTTSSLSTKFFHDVTNGRYLSIARSALAGHLLDRCEGIEARFGNSIIGIDDQKSKVIANLSDGNDEEFDLVVGADGLHSKVRELVFGAQEQFEKHLGFYVAAFILQGYSPRDELTYVSHNKPGRQISRVALRDDQTLFLFVFSKEYVEHQPIDETGEKSTLREIYRDMGWEADAILSRMDEVSDIYFDRVSQIRMAEWTKGRVALLGDAAACASLLAGEGTGLAMTEAYVLAGELHKASDDYQKAFNAYQARLHPYVTNKQDKALGFAEFFVPENWIRLVARELLMNVTSLPFLGRAIMSRNFKSDIELPNYQTD